MKAKHAGYILAASFAFGTLSYYICKNPELLKDTALSFLVFGACEATYKLFEYARNKFR